MTEPKGRSPWFWIGIGCGGMILIVVLVFSGLLVVGWRTAKQLQAELADPAVRTERAAKILGAESLPEGWYSVVNIGIPLLLDIVILADRPVESDGEPADDAELFVYFKYPGGWDRDWREYASGEANVGDWMRQRGVRFEEQEPLVQGTLELDGQQIAWAASRGEFEGHGQSSIGAVTAMLIKCEGDSKARGVIWTAADPAPGVPAAEVDLIGTNADPQRIGALMSQFALCG